MKFHSKLARKRLDINHFHLRIMGFELLNELNNAHITNGILEYRQKKNP